MTAPATRKQLLIGLPKTGKTTFLAALWHVVDSEEVRGALRVSELFGDRDHLNKITEAWRSCKPLDRTVLTAEQIVGMRLKKSSGEYFGELYLPDLSGETLTRQWENLEWSRSFEDLATDSEGVILFVHPREIVRPEKIDFLTDQMVQAVMGVAEESNQEAEPIEAWSPPKACTQVQMTALIQFLMRGPFEDRPFRLAVIVSAWDLVVPEQLGPASWLAKHMPLFDQFLKSNREWFDYRVYGVSAQGGEFKESERLLKTLVPSERILILGAEGYGEHDITAPLKWIGESA